MANNSSSGPGTLAAKNQAFEHWSGIPANAGPAKSAKKSAHYYDRIVAVSAP